MIRGSGLKGLVSLEKKTTIDSINVIRPLLDFEKKNLEFISNHVFDFFIKDPSNENTIFQRIKIRNLIKEFNKNGLDKNKLLLTLKNLKKSNQAIIFYVEKNKKFNSFFDKKKRQLILNNDFFDQPYEIVFRSFSDCLKMIGEKYNFTRGKKVDYILEKIRKNSLIKETLAHCVIKKVNRTIILTKED